MAQASLPLQATREVFGNIAPWMQWAFYLLMTASLGVLVWRIYARAKLWQQGVPGGFETDWKLWLHRIRVFALGQKKVHRKTLGAFLHLLLSSGFIVLTIGTTLLMIAHAGPVDFHVGWYYLIYEFVMDVFGVAFILGCLLAMYRRRFRKPASLGHNRTDWLLLGLLLAMGVTGFVLEALRLHYTQVPTALARWSTIAWAMDQAFLSGLSIESARTLHLATWWIHVFLVAGFFVAIPVTRFMHVLVGPANIAARPTRPMGALSLLPLEEAEKTGRIGVRELAHFDRQQLMSLDSGMECGRCEDACPAWASGKPLSPKALVQDLRQAMEHPVPGQPVMGHALQAETVWSCTMCQACVHECPVLIGHVDLISDLRRNMVAEGELSGPPAKALGQLGKQSNPFGRPAKERFAWANGLDVPTVESNPGFNYLLWLGCSVSYNPRAQKVARSVVQLFQRAKLNFATLGQKERCTGDPARRLGEEFLYQDLAGSNVATLQASKVRKIVTPCPHCLNTLAREYPALGGHFEVFHHSELLAQLVDEGRLKPAAASAERVALHDPCYLARAHDDVHSLRRVLAPLGPNLKELPRHGKKRRAAAPAGDACISTNRPPNGSPKAAPTRSFKRA